jgi:PHP family Zn ribbon phosphoesterase
MSATLKKLIEDELVSKFGKNLYTDEPSNEMSKFTEAIAKAIQTYLETNVKVQIGQAVATAGGPTNQVGTTTTVGNLKEIPS